MNILIKSIFGSFSRTIGRIIAYLFIGFVIYLLIKYLDIDLKSIFPRINLGGFSL